MRATHPLKYNTSHCTTLQCTTVHHITLHYTTLGFKSNAWGCNSSRVKQFEFFYTHKDFHQETLNSHLFTSQVQHRLRICLVRGAVGYTVLLSAVPRAHISQPCGTAVPVWRNVTLWPFYRANTCQWPGRHMISYHMIWCFHSRQAIPHRNKRTPPKTFEKQITSGYLRLRERVSRP